MADKKISELPLLNSVSGSAIIVPMVHDGTTIKLNLSQLAHYSSQWSAKTGSANTFTGNQTINGNLSVSGKITVNELVAVYETASVVFSSGSNIFGDAVNDIHQFTGSVDINGTLILNGSAVGLAQINAFTQSVESQLSKVYNATSSLQQFTASQDSRNFIISEFTSSTDAHIVGISDFTSSQLAVNLGNSIYTASVDSHIVGISTYTSSVRDTLARVHQATASIQATTASINSFTSSTNAHIVGISEFTSSQLAVNLGNAIYTSSVDNHIVGISAFTSSQLAVNFGISLVTASLIGITNTLMGFTASLDNTYATDAQLYQLYQATRSIELHSGSMIGITNGLMAYTSSNETWKTGVRGEISAIEAWTASLDNTYATDAQLYQLYQSTASLQQFTASQDGRNFTLSQVTGSFRGEIGGLEEYTASLKAAAIVSSSTQIQNYDIFALNSNVYSGTGSIKAEIAGIEAYTASLKNVGIISSSTQISNYYKFAETASANTTFYGNVTSNGNIQANKFIFTDGVVSENTTSQKVIGTSGNILYLYTGTSGLYINNQANNAQNVTITDAGVVTTRGGVQIGAPGNDQSLTFGGTNSSIYWGSGGPARMYYNVGDIKISSNGATDVLNVQNIGGILVSGGITGSLMATNGVVSSSQQILNYNTFAVTSSGNTFYGNQQLTGSFGITGSIYINGNHDSGFYYNGNRQFNYAQFYNTQTMSGSADTAYPMWYDTTDTVATADNMIYKADGSKLYVKHTGVYNIQFSAQLGTTATETCEFSIWFAMTGSAIANSNTDITVNKSSGGGNTLAALNLLTPIQSGSYIELMYSKTTANGQIAAKGTQTTPNRPATPSIITTITQVG